MSVQTYVYRMSKKSENGSDSAVSGGEGGKSDIKDFP